MPHDDDGPGRAAAGTISRTGDGGTPTPRAPVPAETEVPVPSLVDRARHVAALLLQGCEPHWRHTRSVARRAASAAGAVPPADRPLLVPAAWLHDIGYAPELRRTGFHPLDGAFHLQEHRWPPPVVGLVAHHSGARYIAEARGLGPLMRLFDADVHARGPLADALTYADQTTGPDGRPMDVDSRLADMLRRHGADSPSARVHAARAPAIRAAVLRTEQRLHRLSPDFCLGAATTDTTAGDRPG